MREKMDFTVGGGNIWHGNVIAGLPNISSSSNEIFSQGAETELKEVGGVFPETDRERELGKLFKTKSPESKTQKEALAGNLLNRDKIATDELNQAIQRLLEGQLAPEEKDKIREGIASYQGLTDFAEFVQLEEDSPAKRLFNVLSEYIKSPDLNALRVANTAVDHALQEMLLADAKALGEILDLKESNNRRTILDNSFNYLIDQAIKAVDLEEEGYFARKSKEFFAQFDTPEETTSEINYEQNDYQESDLAYDTLKEQYLVNNEGSWQKIDRDILAADEVVDNAVKYFLIHQYGDMSSATMDEILEKILASSQVQNAVAIVFGQFKDKDKDNYKTYLERYIRNAIKNQLGERIKDLEEDNKAESNPVPEYANFYNFLKGLVSNEEFARLSDDIATIEKEISDYAKTLSLTSNTNFSDQDLEATLKHHKEMFSPKIKELIGQAIGDNKTINAAAISGAYFEYFNSYIDDAIKKHLINILAKGKSTAESKLAESQKEFQTMKVALDKSAEREGKPRKRVRYLLGTLLLAVTSFGVGYRIDHNHDHKSIDKQEQIDNGNQGGIAIAEINSPNDFHKWYESLSEENQIKAQNFFNLWAELGSKGISADRSQEISKTLESLGVDWQSLVRFLAENRLR